jgi:hypothetical protein
MVNLLGMLAPLPTHRRNLIAIHQHSHDRDDHRRRKMPAGTERCATAEGAEDGWMSPPLFDGRVRLFRKESVGVEDRGASTQIVVSLWITWPGKWMTPSFLRR